MAREPTTDRGRRSRDRIVESAAELVAGRGVEATGIDHVLAAAGASKSQLYHYFTDKDDLVRAVITHRFDQVIAAQAPLLGRLDSWAGIRRWIDFWVGMAEASGLHGCPIGTLASELADRDASARSDLAACFAEWEGYLTAGLTRMKQRGALGPNADPVQLAMAMFASLQGGLLLAKTHKDVQRLRVALDGGYGYLRTFSAR